AAGAGAGGGGVNFAAGGRPPPGGGGPPKWVLAPANTSVPSPILVRPPLPPMAPASVALLPLVSKVPPPALSVTARLVVKPDRNCSVPPPKARPLAAAPRLASAATASTPPLLAVPPE